MGSKPSFKQKEFFIDYAQIYPQRVRVMMFNASFNNILFIS